MHPPGILIVDDHPVYRDALGEKLRDRFEPGGVHVALAADAGEGLDAVRAQPQRRWTVILDILMPGLSGLAGIKAFRAEPQVAHVVALSGLDGKTWETRTRSAGASLFISKNSTSTGIAHKISVLIEDALSSPDAAAAVPRVALTARQQEVLGLIGVGHPNKVIAEALGISEQTVKIHVNQIFKELGVFNRTQAVLKAQKLQLI